jgi:hypothetical protein
MMNKKACHVLGQLQTFIIINCEKFVKKFICIEKTKLGK